MDEVTYHLFTVYAYGFGRLNAYTSLKVTPVTSRSNKNNTNEEKIKPKLVNSLLFMFQYIRKQVLRNVRS